jgi:hypothetical protein
MAHDGVKQVASLRDSACLLFPRHFRAGLQTVPSLRGWIVDPQIRGELRNDTCVGRFS